MRIEAMGASEVREVGKQGLAETQDFMTLLVAQLKAQDPLQPMDASQFLAQLAQLQSVSELSSIGSLLVQMRADQSLGPALSLIGRNVAWRDTASGQLTWADVERVELLEDGARVVAGARALSLGEIVAVR
ncbi:MAG: flagellar hook assembly protein FlgD [Armatimonadota bacterium]